jgi:hypothetical protein
MLVMKDCRGNWRRVGLFANQVSSSYNECVVSGQNERRFVYMIHLSEKAEDVLKDYFKEKEITPIRIFLQTGG